MPSWRIESRRDARIVGWQARHVGCACAKKPRETLRTGYDYSDQFSLINGQAPLPPIGQCPYLFASTLVKVDEVVRFGSEPCKAFPSQGRESFSERGCAAVKEGRYEDDVFVRKARLLGKFSERHLPLGRNRTI